MRRKKLTKLFFAMILAVALLSCSLVTYADENNAQSGTAYSEEKTDEQVVDETTVQTSDNDAGDEENTLVSYTELKADAESTELSTGSESTELSTGSESSSATPAAPVLKKANNVNDGIKITWSESSYAPSYYVFRKTAKGSWKQIAETTKQYYVDKTCKEGKAYYYTVKAVGANGKLSKHDKKGIACVKVQTVKVSKVKNISGGINVKWSTWKKASGYKLYRRVSGSKWEVIATLTSGSYNDTSVKVGKLYEYKVIAYKKYNGKNYSSYSEDSFAKQITKLSAPVLIKATNASLGVKVTWQKMKGAKKYIVYSKTKNGKWTKAGVATGTSFVCKNVNKFKYTYFTVVPVDKLGNKGLYDKTGVMTVYVPQTAVTKAVNYQSYIKVTWNAVPKATGYRLFKKYENGSWCKVGDFTTTFYNDRTQKVSGGKYQYVVKVLYKKGKTTYISSCSKAVSKSVVWIQTSNIKSIESSGTNALVVKWSKSKGAVKYILYRRTDTTGWVVAKTTTATSYTDSSLESGVPYYYTVRAVADSGDRSAYVGGVMGIAGIRAAVAKDAQTYVGKLPYRWGEHSLVTGTDCSGFVFLLYQQYKLYASPASDDYMNPTGFGYFISESELEPGDVVVYKNGGHVAIYIGNGQIVNESGWEHDGIVDGVTKCSMYYDTPSAFVRIYGS